MPFFSVIISVYNKEDYVKSTIDSVLNQSFKDFEIIIVYDGSTDNSLDIIKNTEDSRIVIINKENNGVSAARNTGIKAAKANFIALLDGDDLWDKDYLKFMSQAISKYPEQSVFASALAQKYDHKTVPVTYSFDQKSLFKIHDYFESSLKYSLLSSSSIVFKKDILETIGYFDTNLISGEDTDQWIRLGIYYKIVFINEVLAYYRYTSSGLSITTFSLDKKPKFDKYFKEEKENFFLKKFLDLNRYSLAILAKMVNDTNSYSYYISHLTRKNLNLRQRVLLASPKWALKLLIKIKSLKGEKVYYPTT